MQSLWGCGSIRTETFGKSYSPYGTNATDDADFYLGLGRTVVASAASDILGAKLLCDGAAQVHRSPFSKHGLCSKHVALIASSITSTIHRGLVVDC